MTTINELRTTDRTIRYREMMSRRLKALEAENDGLKLELERARAALVRIARDLTEFRARHAADE